MAVNVERDPSRLYKQTEGWKHRMKSDKGQVVSASGGKLMPHRYVYSVPPDLFHSLKITTMSGQTYINYKFNLLLKETTLEYLFFLWRESGRRADCLE